MMLRKRAIRLVILILLGIVATPARAQTSTTSLYGKILDPDGAVVPGAEVTIANSATGFSRKVRTNEQGVYQFVEIPPATYTLTIQALGFNNVRMENVRLMVSTPATIDQTLRIRTQAESVVVKSEAPLVNTRDATLGHAFSAEQMDSLPFEGRDPAAILSLQPGVVYTGSSDSLDQDLDSRSGSVSGARSDQTDITVDGVDNNDPVKGYAFQGALRTTLDSLEEFRVTTTSANAEAGRSSGAQVTMVTKTGTNKFKGSLYEYNRSGIGEANDWFIKHAELQSGQPNVPVHLVRNTFGGAIGGPILKNRLFFFATYEGQRTHENTIVTRVIPSANLRKGIVSYQCDATDPKCPASGAFTLSPSDLAKLDPNCSTPAPGFPSGTCPLGPGPNPAVETIFQSYPMPNTNTVGDGLNVLGSTFSAPAPIKFDTYIAKLDYNLTSNGNHHLFLRGNLQNDRAPGLETNGPQYQGDPPNQVDANNRKGLAVGYTAALRNTLINDFRYGYVRQSLGRAGLQLLPYINFRAIDNLHGETPTTNVLIPAHNFVDDITWVKGKHTLQFGANLRIINNARQSNATSFWTASTNSSWLDNGAIAGTGSSLDPSAPQFAALGFPAVSAAFGTSYDVAVAALAGLVTEVSANYNLTKNLTVLPQGALVPRHFRSHEAEWYGQDTWRVKPTLMLTFGLRYTLLQPPYETTGTQVAPISGLNQWFQNRAQGMLQGESIQPPVSFGLSGPANGKPPLWAWDYGNVAPRFAFAWSPNFQATWLKKVFGGSGKGSIRGGYGIYYDHFGEGVINSFDRLGAFGLTTSIGNPAGVIDVDTTPRLTGPNTIPQFSTACSSPPCPMVGPAPSGSFPVTPPANPNTGFAITWGLDDKLKTPYSHVVDLSITRELPGGFVLEAAYVGRFGHHLLQQEDMAQPLDLHDPKSGMDWFQAATMFTKAFQAGVQIQNMKPIPYWENFFPAAAGANLSSSTAFNCAKGTTPANPSATQAMYALYSCFPFNELTAQIEADVFCLPACATVHGVTQPFQFWDPQWSSLYAWRTIGNSSYNALQVSLRHRLTSGLQFDLNYTYSKSIDAGSDAERVNQYEGGGFASPIINTWAPNQLRGPSDWDTPHQFNANWMYQLPGGKGKRFATHGLADAILGDWEMTGIFRMTSGFPVTVEAGVNWPTNWENTSAAMLMGPKPETGTFTVNGSPNLFKDPASAIKAFRFAYPGESGQRNNIRGAGNFGIDMGLGKSWKLTESSALRFSWEVFNVTNTTRFDVGTLQPFGGNNSGGNLSLTNNSSFGNYSSTLTKPRVMQFALRYSF
jgi:hypothetical protein